MTEPEAPVTREPRTEARCLAGVLDLCGREKGHIGPHAATPADSLDAPENWSHKKSWARKNRDGEVTRWYCPLDKEDWPCSAERYRLAAQLGADALDALRKAAQTVVLAARKMTPEIMELNRVLALLALGRRQGAFALAVRAEGSSKPEAEKS